MKPPERKPSAAGASGGASDWRNGGFGLYIHWPFCQAKCPYCDFNSHVSARIDHQRWRAAYLHEIDRVAELTSGRTLQTVYFGGGTPSLMEPETVEAMLERIRYRWPRANDWEVTLEANPTSAEAGRFRGFAAAGVNRLSLGVQALNDDALRRLGRMHTAREAMHAFDMARASFARVSFDLIYARQFQTIDGWRQELGEALAMAADHLSLYQLTIESGTAFEKRHAGGGLHGLPDELVSAEMYEATAEMCCNADLAAYEVSNYALPGAESRHNLIYWRCGDYLGIGPGAHGRLTLAGRRSATEARRSPEDWLRAVEKTGSGEIPAAVLEQADQAAEYLMMSLRLAEGSSLGRFERLAGRPLSTDRIAELSRLGMIAVKGDAMACTPAGRLVLNAVLRELLA